MNPALDTLSEVVRSIRLRGEIYARWELTAPWGMALPAGDFAAFHLVEEGQCWLATADRGSEMLRSGELVVLFHGAAHALSDCRGRAAVPIEQLVRNQPPLAPVCRHGGGGPLTRLVCGKFSGEGLRASSGFEAFPSMVRLDGDGPAGRTAALLASEIAGRRAGTAAVVERLSEALVVQVLREVLDRGGSVIDGTAAGWVRAMRDEHVWAALGLIHSSPREAWTVGQLARRVGLSRTVFAERFQSLVGATPMAYLRALRHQLAARLLREGRLSVAEVAARAGYSSVSAFHRAFRKRAGERPAEFRREPSPRGLPYGSRA
jgi:AraC-like DNA-binding protein